MQEYTYLRYTGTVLGSHAYPAPGYRRISFGQNPTHFQQLVTVEAAAYLKAQHGKELLEIPLSMGRVPMALETLISASNLLTDAEKKVLASGYQTLGEIIADQENIYAMLGEYDASKLLNKIRSHFTLPLLPQPVELALVAEEVLDGEEALPDMPESYYAPHSQPLPIENTPKRRKKSD